jgi:hypothetical protein
MDEAITVASMQHKLSRELKRSETTLLVRETVEDQVTIGAAAAPIVGAGTTMTVAERRREAKVKGYEGESCQECGNFTLVRNGTCLKCDTCGGTSGCS